MKTEEFHRSEGTGVIPSTPLRRLDQNESGLDELPGKRQPIPTRARGSRTERTGGDGDADEEEEADERRGGFPATAPSSDDMMRQRTERDQMR